MAQFTHLHPYTRERAETGDDQKTSDILEAEQLTGNDVTESSIGLSFDLNPYIVVSMTVLGIIASIVSYFFGRNAKAAELKKNMAASGPGSRCSNLTGSRLNSRSNSRSNLNLMLDNLPLGNISSGSNLEVPNVRFGNSQN